MTKISVAMASYNGEKYIHEQLVSILSQLSDNDEVIISDDGSTDNTIQIIKKLNDTRIKLIEGPKNGVKKNFENAISNCTGDIIFLADQDDIWLSHKVKTIIKIFDNNPTINLIIHDAEIIDNNKKTIEKSFFNFRKVKNGLFNNLIKNSFIGCCMSFRASEKKYILPIPNDMPMHDQWIGMKILFKKRNSVVFHKEILLKYRRHNNNVSSFKKNTIIKMLKNRLIIIKDLLFY